MPSVNDLLNLAVTASAAAGDFLRGVPRERDPARWTVKGRADWATEVDRAAERLIRDLLLAGTPGATIIGEELSPEVLTRGLVWIVDPLDGTTNFLHGFPAFAVSIAAAVDGVLQAGAVLHVPLNRLSTATLGGGAWENGTRLSVSPISDPEHALIGTGFPYTDFNGMEHYLGQLGRVVQGATGVRRPGSAAIDLADVAAGRFEGFWEQRLSAWDIAAGTLLVREAGGLVTDDSGRALGIEHSPVVAGNPAIHRWLLETLRRTTSAATIDDFARRVADGTPAPAGGGVAAVAAALAAALTALTGRVGLRRAPTDAGMGQLVESADHLRQRLLTLADEDETAYGALLRARRDKTVGEDERAARVLAAWRGAAQVPAEVVRCCRDLSLLARRAALSAPLSTVPEAVLGALLATAVAAGSHLNLRSNVEAAGRPGDLLVLRDESESWLRETQRVAAEVRLLAEERIFGSGSRPPG